MKFTCRLSEMKEPPGKGSVMKPIPGKEFYNPESCIHTKNAPYGTYWGARDQFQILPAF